MRAMIACGVGVALWMGASGCSFVVGDGDYSVADAGNGGLLLFPDAAADVSLNLPSISCTDLASCCASLTFDLQDGCRAVASAAVSSSCTAELTQLQSDGVCGGTPISGMDAGLGDGTVGFDAGAPDAADTQCATLAQCCPSLVVGGGLDMCMNAVASANGGACAAELTQLQSQGDCLDAGTGPCITETCAQAGYQCTPPGATDCSGNPLDCGSCPPDETCSAAGACSASTCSTVGQPCPDGNCCAGATCNAGICSSGGPGTATTLASGLSSPMGIAINASSTTVYFTSGTTVQRIPVGGGTPTTLFSSGITPAALAIDDTNLYWVDVGKQGTSDGSVVELTLATGATKTLATGRSMSGGNTQVGTWGFIASDATYVYWTEIGASGEGSVVRALISGIPLVQSLASSQRAPQGLAVNSTSVYWGDGSNGAQELLSLPLSTPGATPTVLKSAGNFNPFGVVVDSTGLYWTDQSSSTVEMLPIGGSAVSTLASGAGGLIGGIAIDSTDVYWTDQAGGGVRSVSKSGGNMTVLASSAGGGSHGIVVDSTSVYWTDTMMGTVMKTAK